MKKLNMLAVITMLLCSLPFISFAQDDDIYDSGPVWRMTTIRIEANMEDVYLKGLSKTWKTSMDMAKRDGLILDYRVLQGSAANKQDFNLCLMVKWDGMYMLDPDEERKAKWDAIEAAVEEKIGEEMMDKTVANYGKIRDLQGQKFMREIYLK